MAWHHTQADQDSTMKETLHSRHHSTVLPRLGASRKDILHNLHIHEVAYSDIHEVDSDIQLLGNNRVLKYRPPPIATRVETGPEATMHSLIATIRTLPSTVRLQAHGVRRTKQHMY